MPIHYLRKLSSRERSEQSNRHLAMYLAFTAGAVNTAGFFAVNQYTSHMSGMTSLISNFMALGETKLMLAAIGSVIFFILGSACAAILINLSRRRNLQSEYCIPLILESGLLLCFSALGRALEQYQALFVSLGVAILCFSMGLQNAMITKLSRSEIRTTHTTGIITDIGIELGKLVYWNISKEAHVQPVVRANRPKLLMLSSLLLVFMTGGIAGAYGFLHAGFYILVPFALLIGLVAIIPVIDDLVAGTR